MAQFNSVPTVMTPVVMNPCISGCGRGAPNPLTFARPDRTVPVRRTVQLFYQSSLALRRQVQADVLGRLKQANPAAGAALQAQLAQQDFATIYRGITAPFGLRDNDAADVLTAYTALIYLIATGAPDPSPAAVRGLRGQIAAKFAANPQLSAPETRAKLGEELKILFVTLHAGWQSARREGNLDRYADGVARLFQQQGGTDLRQVRLTDAGFVRR